MQRYLAKFCWVEIMNIAINAHFLWVWLFKTFVKMAIDIKLPLTIEKVLIMSLKPDSYFGKMSYFCKSTKSMTLHKMFENIRENI